MCGNEDQKIFKEEESKEILNNICFDDDDIQALRAVDLACWVCFHCSFVYLFALRHSLLFEHLTPLCFTD